MKDKIKNIIGNILIFMQPKKAAELSKNGMTIVLNQKLTLREHLMREAILRKAEKNGDFDSLAEYHNHYWTNKGTDLFVLTDTMFETVFLPDWAFLFDILEEQLANDTNHFNTLVEIGTGNGKVLNYLSSKFPQIEKFVGIDLSQEQTTINKDKFQENLRLEFVASDGMDWVEAHGQSNMIFVTSGGVLEYFTQNRLQELFNKLNHLGKTIFVAIEPTGIDIDFTENSNSQPYGQERSFSHNYPNLFKNSGFSLWHHSKIAYPKNGWFFNFIGAKN